GAGRRFRPRATVLRSHARQRERRAHPEGGRLMSAATAAAAPRAVPGEEDLRPGLTRLAAVELRKMVDTRAGFWLLVGVVLLTVVVVVAPVLSKHAHHSLEGLF